jgi:hypothetical protein
MGVYLRLQAKPTLLGPVDRLRTFLTNYASCVGGLLPLLKKGSKWKWTTEIGPVDTEFRIFLDVT